MPHSTEGFVLEPDGVAQLKAYGVPYPEHGVAGSVEEAVSLADRIGYPVVLKIVSADVPHKSDVGGVALGLADAEEVRAGYEQITARVHSALPEAAFGGILVCKQSAPGTEVIVGATEDPVFGMTIMFGLGGIFTEILKDVSFRAIPLQLIDAQEMIREIKGYPILTGARGHESCDLDRLAELLVSVSRFVADHAEVGELDLNPVRVRADGLDVLDVRIINKPTRNEGAEDNA